MCLIRNVYRWANQVWKPENLLAMFQKILFQQIKCQIVESMQYHSIHTVPLVQWSTRLLLPWGTRVQSSGGYLSRTGILLLALSRYIGDHDVIDHCDLVWGGLHPEPSLGCHAYNVIIPLDLIQPFYPSFTPAADPPSGFTTDIVGCWGGALWRACNLTYVQLAFSC